ncbi:MAG: hypothetical protein IE916_10475 [Epsilonproteobacteria bacterium]|nr:hypothetical protein [Campylobacterota bacterium]
MKITKVVLFLAFCISIAKAQENIRVDYFYTSWCPPCQKGLELMRIVESKNIKVRYIEIVSEPLRAQTDSHAAYQRVKSEEFIRTLKSSRIPYILLYSDDKVIKRYNELPQERFFIQLLQRVQEGYLENGTLPIEKRVDLWKKERD